MKSNTQLELASEFIFNTNKSVFLTGKAGTGKTTFLSNLKKSLPKRMIVVAPTGVAAINAGGVTVHSFFQLSFGPNIPGSEMNNANVQRFGREKINLIKSLDLLVIDEVSMLRADLLDAIDAVLRRFKDRNKPFGGAQLLLIGDLQQLAPVVKEEEWSLLRPHYETVYFFSSHAIKQLDLVRIELTHIYRQTDADFIGILNQVRDNKIDEKNLTLLNSRHLPDFLPKKGDGYITLTTHNSSALKINVDQLNRLSVKSHFFDAEISGDFPAYAHPTEEKLELKVGAQVMFVKNDATREKRYYNGKIGEITSISGDMISVKCPGEYDEIEVEPATWTNVKYHLNTETKEVEEQIVGTFIQFPLKLAWAITIHKSQGLTFERAIIDANLSFAHGQVYVALSRCKTLEGMVLSTAVERNSIRTDEQIISFSRETTENPPSNDQLSDAKIMYQKMTLFELFDWESTQRALNRVGKALRENPTIVVEETRDRLRKISDTFESNLFSVGIKFRSQLNNLLNSNGIDENEAIQERIKKGATYFIEKVENEILPEVKLLNPESDNAVFKKSFKQAKEDLERNLFIKTACLKAAEKGFSVKEYLKVRADADIDFKPSDSKSDKLTAFKANTDGQLYSILKTWRNNLASEHDVPEYMIIQVKTMMEIASKLPTSIEQLAAIKGIGKTKAKKFGAELIEIVKDYCGAKGIEVRQTEIDLQPTDKLPKIPSKQVTFELLQSGKSISEIAEERNLSMSTVESHLHPYIESKELDIYDVYPAAKIKKIFGFLDTHEGATVTEIKQALDDDEITFSGIRAAISAHKGTTGP